MAPYREKPLTEEGKTAFAGLKSVRTAVKLLYTSFKENDLHQEVSDCF